MRRGWSSQGGAAAHIGCSILPQMAKSPTSGARKEAHFDISEVSAGLSLQRHPGLRKFTISGTDGIIRAGLSWSQLVSV